MGQWVAVHRVNWFSTQLVPWCGVEWLEEVSQPPPPNGCGCLLRNQRKQNLLLEGSGPGGPPPRTERKRDCFTPMYPCAPYAGGGRAPPQAPYGRDSRSRGVKKLGVGEFPRASSRAPGHCRGRGPTVSTDDVDVCSVSVGSANHPVGLTHQTKCTHEPQAPADEVDAAASRPLQK